MKGPLKPLALIAAPALSVSAFAFHLGATHLFDKFLEGRRVIEVIHSMAADLRGHEVTVGSVAG